MYSFSGTGLQSVSKQWPEMFSDVSKKAYYSEFFFNSFNKCNM